MVDNFLVPNSLNLRFLHQFVSFTRKFLYGTKSENRYQISISFRNFDMVDNFLVPNLVSIRFLHQFVSFTRKFRLATTSKNPSQIFGSGYRPPSPSAILSSSPILSYTSLQSTSFPKTIFITSRNSILHIPSNNFLSENHL